MNKNKLTFCITTMIMVTIVAITCIILVFAARQQAFTSNISVSYTASQITGKVSANYYVGVEDTSGTAMTTANGDTELIFYANTTLTNATLNPKDKEIALELGEDDKPDKSWAVFEYVFQNGLSGVKNSTDYIAVLNFSGTAENMDITSLVSDNKLSPNNFSTITSPISTPSQFTSSVEVPHSTTASPSVRYFYVKVAIHNIGADAEFSGDFNWNLSYIDPSNPSQPLPTIDKLHFEPYSLGDTQGWVVSAAQLGDDFDGNIVIPASYQDKPVVAIANDAFNFGEQNSKITSIILPDTITSIGERAFMNCSGLTEITIPKNVNAIGNAAFAYMPNLTTVYYNAVRIEDLCSNDDSLDRYKLFVDINNLSEDNISSQNMQPISIIIGDDVTHFPFGFGLFNVKSVLVGKNVTVISGRAFLNLLRSPSCVILDSPAIYSVLGTRADGCLCYAEEPSEADVYILASIDNGTNKFLTYCTKGEQTEIKGKMYNYYHYDYDMYMNYLRDNPRN